MNVSQMSLRQKIGQLMMIGFHGTRLSEKVQRMIVEDCVGGIILFGRNIGTPEEVLRLTSDLQTCAKTAGHPFPLLISIDQENGVVRRLGKGTTLFPGNRLLGAVDDEKVTRHIARATAEELKRLGINMNLAPVLDVNNNPQNPVIGVRSFGESVDGVIRHGLAFIEGHQAVGVVTTAKHFPGHGDTDVDSHLDLPTVPHGLKRLETVELRPFQEAIDAGVCCVMIAHVFFPAFEAEDKVPATLSHSVVTGLLREKMGFNGVVTTDCLEMDAVSKTIGTVEGALRALKAGVDVLMISHSHDLQEKAMERIAQAVESGELEEEVIDRSVRRILLLKERYLSWHSVSAAGKGVPDAVGASRHRELAKRAYARGVTLLKDDGILPLSRDTDCKILVVAVSGKNVSTPVEDPRYADYRLADAVRRYRPGARDIRVGMEPTKDEMKNVERHMQSADVVVFGTVNAHLHRQQAELVNRLSSFGKPVVVVAMRDPYDLTVIPNVSAYVAAYEYTLHALNAAVDIVFGK